jgi:hypothetical protein
MEGAEPFVERYEGVSIVALEILMVEVMSVAMGVEYRLVTDDQFVKAGMRLRWPQSLQEELRDEVKRIR